MSAAPTQCRSETATETQLASVFLWKGERRPQEANARLIASAPDMLAALEKHRDLLLQIAGAVMCDNLASISGLLEAEWDDMAAADLIAKAKGDDA